MKKSTPELILFDKLKYFCELNEKYGGDYGVDGVREAVKEYNKKKNADKR